MTSPESGQGSPTGPVLHMVPALGSLSGLAQGCDGAIRVPVCLGLLPCSILGPCTGCLFQLVSIGIVRTMGT